MQPVASPDTPSVIEDARHGDESRRNSHFFWLPPLVPSPDPAPTGAPDPAVLASLRVDVCDLGDTRPQGTSCSGKPLIATFTEAVASYITTGDGSSSVTTGTTAAELVRYDPVTGSYKVNWHTDKTPLLTTHYYRIRVLAAGVELGQADIDVLRTARDLKNYDTGNTIPLVDGRTLPIQFRVEVGAIKLLEPGGAPVEIGKAGGTVATSDGAVAIKLPVDAVPEGTSIRVESAAAYPPGPEPWAPVYELTASVEEFAQPVTVSLALDFDRLPEDVPPTSLALYVATDHGWELVPNGTVNLDENTVSAPTSHFSIYAVRIAPNTLSGTPTPTTLPVGGATTLSGFAASYQAQSRQECWKGAFGRVTCRTYTSVTHYPEYSAIYWTSSQPGVALPEPRVTYTGSNGTIQTTVRGVAPGGAEIRAQTPNGVVSNPVGIAVFAPVASVEVAPNPATVMVGRMLLLTATLRASDSSTLSGRPVTWSSSDPDVATVSPGGLVTGVRTGTATISASSEGKVGTSPVTVEPGPPVRWDRERLHIAQFQGAGSNISIPEPLATDLHVGITHLRPGVTTSNAAHPIPAGRTTAPGGLSIRGGSVGTDTLVTSAAGYSPDSLEVQVSALGRIAVQGWPTQLRWGDSAPVQLKILNPDGAFGHTSTAVSETFALSGGPHVTFSNGSAPITNIVVNEGVQASAVFYVKYAAAGPGTVQITNPHYETYATAVTLSPFTIGGFDNTRAAAYSFVTGSALGTARSLVTASFPDAALTGFPTLTPEALSATDMVVLNGLRSNIERASSLTSAEQSALAAYVRQGGCALLMIEAGAVDVTLGAPFGIVPSGGLNNAVLFTVTAPAASLATSGPFGVVSSFVGNFVTTFADIGPYALARATTAAGIGMVEILPDAIAPRSGRVIAVADANVFSNDLGFMGDARNQALLRNIVAACR